MKKLFFYTITIITLLTVAGGKGFCQLKNQSLKVVFETKSKDIATELNKAKIYILKKKAINADFNYSGLNDMESYIMDTLKTANVMPIFEPINGQFDYYQFIATFKGESYEGGIKDFHDILIVKTDKENKIIDAFQYTLEWAELPFQYDLFKSSVNNVILTNDLDIKLLKFMRTYSYDGDDMELSENGVIKLK